MWFGLQQGLDFMNEVDCCSNTFLMPFCSNIYLLSFLQWNGIYFLLNRNTYRFDFIERKTYKSLLIEVIFDQNRVSLNVIELQGDEEFTSTNRSWIINVRYKRKAKICHNIFATYAIFVFTSSLLLQAIHCIIDFCPSKSISMWAVMFALT